MFNKKAIKSLIPHRDPFLFLDCIDDIEMSEHFSYDDLSISALVGGVVTASFKVNEDHSIFKGHFPGNPVWPGVVQVEMMAQASCFILNCIQDNYQDRKLEVALLSIGKTRFRNPVKPGALLKIISKCERIRGPMASFSAQLFEGDNLVSETSFMATFSFSRVARPSGIDDGMMSLE